MKKLQLFLFTAALAQAAAGSPVPPDLTLRVTPDRDVVYRAGPHEVIVQVEIEGRRAEDSRRAPMNLALVLDRSGSMEGAKIEKARQAASIAVDKLGDDDYFSLVTYDNETNLLVEPERVGGSRHRAEMKARIQHIQPGGSTALHAGVVLGAKQVRHFLDSERVNRVILLSDGIANVGPSSTSDLASLGRELRSDGIAVSTVGLGDDYNEDLMTALAEASNANYYYVKDAEKLPGIFAQELGAARSLLARSVIIRITAPDGVHLKEIIGRPDIECRDRVAEIKMPEVFGSEKRRFLVRCVTEGIAAKAIEAAQVELNYATLDGSAAPTQRQAAKIAFTDDEKKADASIQVKVAREYGVVQNRLAKEMAVKLADEGKPKDAIAVLRKQAAANAAAPAPMQVPGVAEENQKLEAAASEIDAGGQLAKSRRKAIQFENYADKYQKDR
ncbi:MAG TPA: VWA domain-containing protein [Chthoniobacterales bacterium]|nr:VWA domain-containing protein [Chthoniobacterales bacterium]